MGSGRLVIGPDDCGCQLKGIHSLEWISAEQTTSGSTYYFGRLDLIGDGQRLVKTTHHSLILIVAQDALTPQSA